MASPYANLAERILANTMISDELFYNGTPCWLWIGARNASGYGKLNMRFKKGPRKGKVKSALAHRVALMEMGGRRLGSKSVVMHLCNNRLCCNPRPPQGRHAAQERSTVRGRGPTLHPIQESSMKPTILEAIHHLSEHYGLTLAEVQALVRTPLHPAGLRDDLAARAMQGTLSSGRINIDLAAKRYAKDISESAYALADAMLKAREK